MRIFPSKTVRALDTLYRFRASRIRSSIRKRYKTAKDVAFLKQLLVCSRFHRVQFYYNIGWPNLRNGRTPHTRRRVLCWFHNRVAMGPTPLLLLRCRSSGGVCLVNDRRGSLFPGPAGGEFVLDKSSGRSCGGRCRGCRCCPAVAACPGRRIGTPRCTGRSSSC